MNGTIYLAVNRINQKAYVGQTVNRLAWRMMRHYGDNLTTPFCRALKKYGRENFDIAVLETCTTREDLDKQECHWIAHFGSMIPNGYNLTEGGYGASGFKHPPESTEKHSAARKALWLNPEYREKHALQHWAHDPERAAKIKADLSARTKQQHADGVLGGYRGGGIKTEASKAKASKSAKLVWSNPEYRAAQSAKKIGRPSPLKGTKTGKPSWNRGKKMPADSLETIAKRTASIRALWRDPEFRRRQLHNLHANRTPESYEKSGRKISETYALKRKQKQICVQS